MNEAARIRSWGGLTANPQHILRPAFLSELVLPSMPWLAYGNGRSYGDSCFPDQGISIQTRSLNKVIRFDPSTGMLKAQPGLLLADLLDLLIPLGWFPPVVPGTSFVTLGGAVANDIHGKNHHVNGTFGEHVARLELLRSGGERLTCSPNENSDLFRATIGGMGLTGLITSLELQLMRIPSPDVIQEALPLNNLADFFRLAAASDASHAYSVAWLDSLAKDSSLGRGVLLRANHALDGDHTRSRKPARLSVPFTLPFSPINSVSLAAFNRLYRLVTLRNQAPTRVGWQPFFFPLDAVGHWNRLYGPRGLRQHQSVIPLVHGEATVAAMLEATHAAGHGSFLTVLKLFAERPSAGIMSFPKPGVTLTLDFPYRGAQTDLLLDRLDSLTLAAGGRVNPYKDAHMRAETFAASYPEAQAFRPYIDPMARSQFSSRVGLTIGTVGQGDVKNLLTGS